jgi:hypothetical protein
MSAVTKQRVSAVASERLLAAPRLPGPAAPTSEPEPAESATEPWDVRADDEAVMSPAEQRAVNAKLATLPGIAVPTAGGQTPRRRPIGGGRAPRTVVYVHLTDRTLATGSGVLRVEGAGPLLATQLSDLVGHRPYLVKPVIDLNDKVSVDAYETPHRLRERLKLMYPVEQFPYGTAETTLATDLDHIEPFDPHGPPGQTNTTNLSPLRRFSHRVKTHGRWKVRRLPDGALEWTSPHQFKFRVDHRGTHPFHP